MELFKKSSLMFWSIWLLVIAVLIFICTKIDFLFAPVGTFISTLFAPIVIAGFLYYMLNPLIHLLEKMKIKRGYGIAIIFLLLIGGLVFLAMAVIPNLVSQIGQLVNNVPKYLKDLESSSNDLINQGWLKDLKLEEKLQSSDFSIEKIAKNVFSGVTSSVGSIVGAVTNMTIVVLTVPIVLFYMFKDGDKFGPSVTKFVPSDYRDKVSELLSQMSNTIASYISGQALVCLFVGTFTFVGYLIIDLPYGFLLGFIAGITNIIPFIGPYIGIAPALIIGFIDSPFKAILVCVVVLIVQQIDSNLISPNVIGKTLAIHPLTIIIILLVAGNIAGIIGMILGVPFYAVTKTVILYVYDILKLRKEHRMTETKLDK
ncbi:MULTISPECIES: AI-2E family transporter [Carnobacterium]|uniref:AI-2E family transporter n=1 Tax=Carnobacterium divergens TaxID=2748 RepID=A0A2R7ZZF0_CARDV|nr:MULTISPECIES: AI-2E family transporter [Carnobacterium]MCO6018067.1 AI-2E family transporter [Carnobacterium divergens]MDT1938576.1 AI-2E family transporter [Carnobacterium divergens]MDT1941014.1 AI-2E family transporter [Carnobacterium divergens]MDT1946812.1 AI-2E family transporter [Carnobacterium divergens]MDT1949249.1 AI-2E family transporter [Carnobacterium divergens]